MTSFRSLGLPAAAIILTVAVALLRGVAPATAQPLDDVLELSLPAYSWAMTIPAKGFVKERDETAGDGTTRRVSATNPETGVSVLGFLEQFRPRATSTDCRELYWTGFSRRLDLKREKTRLFERGDFAMVEYLIPELQGTSINQKNLWIYFAKEGTCGYFHLSKPRFTAADEPVFARIVEGARITARP